MWQILKCERIPGNLLTLLSNLQGLAYPLSAVCRWEHLTLLALVWNWTGPLVNTVGSVRVGAACSSWMKCSWNLCRSVLVGWMS